MQAMNRSGDKRGNGSFDAQVRQSLREAGKDLQGLDQVRDNVFFVYTSSRRYVLKGFGSERKLQAQKNLTKKLRKNGFKKTYRFIDDIPSFSYRGEIYEFIEFLNGSNHEFTYHSRSNREEGMDLLDDFHRATGTFSKDLFISEFDQVKKWEERIKEFSSYADEISRYVPDNYIEEWLSWGRRGLDGLKKYENRFYDERSCIVHGDVAHHNFFRKRSGSLYLIDFDLISKGPPVIDFLQYANRIMPHINGTEELFSYKQLNRYRGNKAFLYALVFPTDIFREWNRLMRLGVDKSELRSVWKLSVDRWKDRENLYEDISRML